MIITLGQIFLWNKYDNDLLLVHIKNKSCTFLGYCA